MPVKQCQTAIWHADMFFSVQLGFRANTNGYKWCLGTAEMLTLKWSTLVILGPRPFLLPWPTFLSTLGLPARQNILMKFTWPEGIQALSIATHGRWCNVVRVLQDHPSTGDDRCLFFLFLFTSASFRRVRFRLAAAWLLQNENGRESKLIIECQVYLKYTTQYTYCLWTSSFLHLHSILERLVASKRGLENCKTKGQISKHGNEQSSSHK